MYRAFLQTKFSCRRTTYNLGGHVFEQQKLLSGLHVIIVSWAVQYILIVLLTSSDDFQVGYSRLG